MENSQPKVRAILPFFGLVFLLSVPFWILGAIAPDFTKISSIKLPVSALITICPLIAAIILVYKKRTSQGVIELLTLAFDFKKIKDKRWYLPIVCLIPVMAVLSYGYTKFTGALISSPQTPILSILTSSASATSSK